MVAEAKELAQEHPDMRAFFTKLMKDNIGMLAAFVSWTILTSIAPIAIGLVFLTTLFLHSPSAQANIVSHLSSALQGAISPATIRTMVKTSTQHAGLLGIIGLVGVFWGGSAVGGAFSTAFQPIFEVSGRNFLKEKLIDIGMIFVFTALMLIIIAGTSAGALLNGLFSGFPLPGVVQFVIGTAISLLAAFILFVAIYLVFPNIQPGFKYGNVWKGALVAAVLFEILTYIWPIYSHFAHFNKYGAVLFPILVLTAWIYFFSMITMIGAEVIAVFSIQSANRKDESIGPKPQDNVPQHTVLRETRPSQPASGTKTGKAAVAKETVPVTTGQSAADSDGASGETSDEQIEHDRAFWLMAATPLAVAVVAGAVE